MVKFEIIQDTIELVDYSADATLPELVAELEEFRKGNALKTKDCKGCGYCCGDDIPVLGLDLPMLMQGLDCSLDELKDKYLILPEHVDVKSRQKSISEMSKLQGISLIDAVLLYEYNTGEPLILSKQGNGDCCLLKVAENDGLTQQKLCSLYTHRPFSCGLYLCNMGEKLAFIQEMIIRQGTWYAYSVLGWIDEKDISHNPFLKVRSYEQLRIKDFDYQLQNALEQLFFYF